eukprot:245358_1
MASFSYTIIIAMIFTTTVYGVSNCVSADHCIAECNQVYTGFYEDTDPYDVSEEVVFFYLTLSEIQKVTFTNCGSIDFTSTSLRLDTCPDSSGTSCVDQITSQSDSGCTESSCVDDPNYECSDNIGKTFTFSYLAPGTYELRMRADSDYQYGQYQIQIFCAEPGSGAIYATFAPLANLNDYSGSSLLLRGYNIFTATSSGSLILREDQIQNITEIYSTDGATCTYSSLQFSDQFTFYSEYAKSDSQSIAAGFSTEAYGAGGSLTTARTQTRSYAESGQYSIYSLDLQCIAARASVVEYNNLHWNPSFIDAVRILPTDYESGDSLEDFIEFWDAYGTHMFETAYFGGSIHGSVVSDKCAIERSFGSSTQYEVCLNAAYKGIEVEGCNAESDSSSSYDAMSSSIENTYIEVKGGPLTTYQSIFSEFKDKETDFSEWISDLASYPDVVGGNIDPIHDAIQRAIKLGDHKLNALLSSAKAMSDEEWLSIADTLEAAYIDYAKDLAHEHNYFGKGECSATCNGHRSNSTECVCVGCKNALDCCDRANQYKTIIVYLCVLFLIVLY